MHSFLRGENILPCPTFNMDSLLLSIKSEGNVARQALLSLQMDYVHSQHRHDVKYGWLFGQSDVIMFTTPSLTGCSGKDAIT